MKRTLCLFCLALFPTLLLHAYNEPPRGPTRSGVLDVANPCIENRVQHSGFIALSVSNFGYFGNFIQWTPPFEYPEGSGNQYLYQAALWIGAEIDTGGNWIRRVSVGTDGWFNPSINEFWPGEGAENEIQQWSNIPGSVNCFGEEVYHPDARANEEFIAVYSDTLTDDFWLVDDPVDGLHLPLGLRVEQRTMSWYSPSFSSFVIIEFNLRNIGQYNLRNIHLGFYCDGDVGYYQQLEHHVDDISGFLLEDPQTDETVNIAWLADNDGRPVGDTGSILSYPHALGFAFLSPFDSDRFITYNWWVSHSTQALDFGPQWEGWSSPYPWLPGDEYPLGTPLGDRYKYRLLSGGEQDYGQVYADDSLYIASHPQLFHDPCTGEDTLRYWRLHYPGIEPGFLHSIANGYDARFLLAVGPLGIPENDEECNFQLNPGEEITVTAVLLIGPDFHNQDHPQPNPDDIDPSLFDYTGLINSLDAARFLFENDYQYQPPVAPDNFRIVESPSETLLLAWDLPQTGEVDGYNLFGIQGDAEPIQFNEALITETEYEIGSLQNGSDWLLQIETVDPDGWVSSRAEIPVRVGAPLPIEGLEGETENGTVWLRWESSPENNVTEYIIYRQEGESTPEIFTSVIPRFVDQPETGREYTYWIIAENDISIQSLPGDSAILIPVDFEERILILDQTTPAEGVALLRGGIPHDSVFMIYNNILDELDEPYDYFQLDPQHQNDLSFDLLSDYDLIIWHSEDNLSSSDYNFMNFRERTFLNYIEAGGRLLRFGRRVLGGKMGMAGMIHGSGPWGILDSLDVDSAYAELSFFSSGMKFIGANDNDDMEGYPGFTLDADKLLELTWGTHHFDYLPEIDRLWPHDPANVIYRSVVQEPETPGYGDQPVAIMAPGQIFFAFNLWFLSEWDAKRIVETSIGKLRAMDYEAPEASLGIVQNPVETANLNLLITSREALVDPITVYINGTDFTDWLTAHETYPQSLTYHAAYRLTVSDAFSLSAEVCDLSGNTTQIEREFTARYLLPGSPPLLLTTPGGEATLSLESGAVNRASYLIAYADRKQDDMNLLSPAVTFGSPSWELEKEVVLTIRCDLTAGALAHRTVHVVRLEGSQWLPVQSAVTVEGSRVQVPIDRLGTFAVMEGEAPAVPQSTELYPAYPNPFNPFTTLRFDLAMGGNAKLTVFNVLGQQVRVLMDGSLPAGVHQAVWDGANDAGRQLSSGVYFARLETAQAARVVKMVLLR